MNFIKFPVAATNIFPAANDTKGAQLLTEWNIRSREMISSPSAVTYECGLSYTHGLDDFSVSLQRDDAGKVVSTTVLQIDEGRALVNGHYIESLAPITIDLLEANASLKKNSKSALKGALTVGLRVYYATEETIAGTILTSDDEGYYLGIQVIVLPSEEFITPEQSPTDSSKVTAHLKLATFTFNNNTIGNIVNYEDKIRYIEANRLKSIESIVSDEYVTKTGLNSKKIYAFAGKGSDPSTGLDTWEDVTDSMIVWDKNPVRTSTKPSYDEAQFVSTSSNVYLCAPHKAVQGMEDESGNPEYYEPKLIAIPNADYATSTPGLVSKDYTAQIKDVASKIDKFRNTLTGKQIYYLDSFSSSDSLPTINKAWSNGDYVLVGLDYTQENSDDGVTAPSTMYVVLPGHALTIKFHSKVESSDEVPSDLTGVELVKENWAQDDRQSEPETEDPNYFPEFWDSSSEEGPRGTVGKDYFVIRYVYSDRTYANFYYTVDTVSSREWSDAILVTGSIPLAEENTIGGFLNVSTDNTDYGYVYRDDYGRLKLVDYALLRTGVLAYQLGEDLTITSGITAAETQTYITEYVNQRVAFPSSKQLESDSPNMIHIYFSLYEEDEATTINIGDIDSRFNTAVCLHILGSATSTCTINIYDCEKLKIDNAIEGTPVINVYRTNLYYDPYVFNYIRSCTRDTSVYGTDFTGMQDISIWYDQFDSDDPNLLVDGMTVSELDAPITPTSLDYWKESGSDANDNYYLCALDSITFDPSGTIVKCGLLVANQSTDNVSPGSKIIVSNFTLPQGTNLSYPKACLTKQLKVSGTFVSAYYSSVDSQWYVTDTSFSALSNAYDEYDQTVSATGTIAFHSTTTLVDSTISQTSIPAWETDTYHIFYGGSIS